MTASWMTTTLDKPREGGNALLAPGVSNYKITGAEAGANPFNGRNEVTLRLSGDGGSGKTTIPLEPWSSEPKDIETFVKMFNNGLGNIGVPVEGMTAQAVLTQLPKTLPGTVGNIVECNVVHSDRKPKSDGSHLKQDGTPWQDQKVYINRLVQEGSTAGSSSAPTSDFTPVNPGMASDDDIPF